MNMELTSEVLVWGDITKNLNRLGIEPILTYLGESQFGVPMKVYIVTMEELKIMSDDKAWDNTEEGCWRWSSGSNLGNETRRYNINDKYIQAWDGRFRQENKGHRNRKYDNILIYLSEEIGISTEGNVTACLVHLAKLNNMSVSELMLIYKG